MLTRTILTLGLLVASSTAMAVSLQNRDSKKYSIKVSGKPSTYTGSIDSGAVKSNVCSSCEITVDGVGSVKASGSSKVVIKGGKLSVN